jgi:hypothetical protein
VVSSVQGFLSKMCTHLLLPLFLAYLIFLYEIIPLIFYGIKPRNCPHFPITYSPLHTNVSFSNFHLSYSLKGAGMSSHLCKSTCKNRNLYGIFNMFLYHAPAGKAKDSELSGRKRFVNLIYSLFLLRECNFDLLLSFPNIRPNIQIS